VSCVYAVVAGKKKARKEGGGHSTNAGESIPVPCVVEELECGVRYAYWGRKLKEKKLSGLFALGGRGGDVIFHLGRGRG